MLQPVAVGSKNLSDYTHIVGRELIEEIHVLAEPLKGARVLHVSATWRRYNEMNARELVGGWDVCLVHDPQPAALFDLVPEKARGWIWRCHIDMSQPNAATIARLLP